MSDTHPAPSPAPGIGHEESDVSFPIIIWTTVGLLGSALIVLLVSWGLFDHFSAREAEVKKSPFPLAAEERGKLPPAPRLEGIKTVEEDLSDVHPVDVQSYGWVDKANGVIRIPINQAMKIMLDKGMLRAREDKK